MCQTHERSASGSPGHGGTITAAVRALIPSHPACAEALALAKSSLPASILYHSLRVFLYAQAFLAVFQDSDSVTVVPPSTADTANDGAPNATAGAAGDSGFRSASVVLFVACILHDVSTAADYDAVPERFEVVAADAAVRVLLAHGFPEATARDAWLAMALHTSPGIAERLGGIVRAVRLAVRADFGSHPPPAAKMMPGGADTMDVIRWKLPRLEIEKDLGDAVVRQTLVDAQKAPKSSWPGDLMRAKRENPEWEGVNKGF